MGINLDGLGQGLAVTSTVKGDRYFVDGCHFRICDLRQTSALWATVGLRHPTFEYQPADSLNLQSVRALGLNRSVVYSC